MYTCNYRYVGRDRYYRDRYYRYRASLYTSAPGKRIFVRLNSTCSKFVSG